MRVNLNKMAFGDDEKLSTLIAAAATLEANGLAEMELESVCVCNEVMHTQAFKIGFPPLPITCPHCHRLYTSHEYMHFRIIVDEVKND